MINLFLYCKIFSTTGYCSVRKLKSVTVLVKVPVTVDRQAFASRGCCRDRNVLETRMQLRPE